jgi:lipopolysaccharide biosynthesis glycosyltransferase
MEAMKFAYSYIERGPSGEVLNAALKPFDSFSECCAAAEEAANADSALLVQFTQVIYCRYNGDQCIPEMQSVLRTYERNKVCL